MKHHAHIILLLCLLPMLEGCATIVFANAGRDTIVNDKKAPLWPVYSRSHFDLHMLYFPIWAFTPSNDEKGDNAYAKAFAVTLGPFMMAFGAADLPISAVVDTLTLPWDRHDMNSGRDKQE